MLLRVVKPLTVVTAVTAVSGLRQAYNELMPRTLVLAAACTGEEFRASKHPLIKLDGLRVTVQGCRHVAFIRQRLVPIN